MKKTMDWLPRNGEMANIIRSHNWTDTPLGSMDQWDPSLRTALSICLGSKFPMFVWWGSDLLVFYNDAYIPFTGLKHPQFLGRPAREQWAEIWDKLIPLTEQVLNTGIATWAESMLLFMNRKGFSEETYFTFSYSPICDATGKVVGIINPCKETTERVLSERRLKCLQNLSSKEVKTVAHLGKVSTEVFNQYSADIPFSLIYLTNTDQKGANLIATSGIPEGTPLSPLKIDITSGNVFWPVVELYQSGKPQEIKFLRKYFADYIPKSPYPEGPDQALMMPFFAGNQEIPMGFLVLGISPRLVFDHLYQDFFSLICKQISNQISQVKGLEEERKRAEALEEINQAKTDFFNNISHELRTPLTLILGPLENILSEHQFSFSNTAYNDLQIMYRNANRLLKLVNNLLDFSRLEYKTPEIYFESVDLSQLTNELISSFASSIQHAGIKLNINCQTLKDMITVDKVMWEKIVLNLISNAFKYTLSGGSISISLTTINKRIQFKVSDTGIGIPQKELTRIFERFHRVKGAKGRTHEGTGIGLALVKELVHLHNGSISVESVINKGSTFTVEIPCKQKHSIINRKKEDSSNKSADTQAFIDEAESLLTDDTHITKTRLPKSLGRIVLAEDNGDMRKYITNVLDSHFDIVSCTNGQEALEEIIQNPPDLVLSDVMMPVMNGFELIDRIRQEKFIATLPIILLSARAGHDSAISGIESGADDYLVKPFSAKELLIRVKQHLRMQNLRKQVHHQLLLIQELSLPILELDERLLFLPLIGEINSHRMKHLSERLLKMIRIKRAKVVILDLTGVTDIEQLMIQNLMKVIQAAKLMGTKIIMTGLSPSVAQSFVDKKIDTSQIIALNSLKASLRRVRHTIAKLND